MRVIADASDLKECLDKISKELRSPRKLLIEVGRYKVAVTRQNFEKERSPNRIPWRDLKRGTWLRKQTNFIGRESFRLYEGTDYEINLSDKSTVIFNNVPYAAFFQALRPFLDWSSEDEERVFEIGCDYIIKVIKSS
ncbi:MAG: hypothetical protein F6K24_05115 [Okeania sp. SIO2D1]|nr:hypothetical protein [Okeania sp. SIO2D1]